MGQIAIHQQLEAMGMLAIGAGGLDVAVAMGGGEYFITMPKVVKVNLIGQLKPMVSAKDIILEILKKINSKRWSRKSF